MVRGLEAIPNTALRVVDITKRGIGIVGKGAKVIHSSLYLPADSPELPIDKFDYTSAAIYGGLGLAFGVTLAEADAAMRQAGMDFGTADAMRQWFVQTGLDSTAKTIVDGIRPWFVPATAGATIAAAVAGGFHEQLGSCWQKTAGHILEGRINWKSAIGNGTYAFVGTEAALRIGLLLMQSPAAGKVDWGDAVLLGIGVGYGAIRGHQRR